VELTIYGNKVNKTPTENNNTHCLIQIHCFVRCIQPVVFVPYVTVHLGKEIKW